MTVRSIALAATLLTLTAAPALADDVRDLFAGQNTDIGEVRVCDDGSDLFVTYDSSDSDWYLTTTHLYADTAAPKHHAPGRFAYSNKNILTQVDEYQISLASLGAVSGGGVFLAAHAETDEAVAYAPPSLELALDIPSTVSITSTFPGGDSYWNTTVSGGSSLDGTYDGWCVDNQTTMSPGATYTAAVYSTYDVASEGYVPYGENLDLINHIVNQDWVGQTSSACGGSYPVGTSSGPSGGSSRPSSRGPVSARTASAGPTRSSPTRSSTATATSRDASTSWPSCSSRSTRAAA